MKHYRMKHQLYLLIAAGMVLLLSLSPAKTPAVQPAADKALTTGDQVPDITLKNLEGEAVSLQSLRGKVVLVYFWASWCKPCRKNIPTYVKLYKKYKDARFEIGKEGFAVYSISLDKERSSWKKASRAYKFPWENNMCDLKGWESEGVKQFGIGSIPRSFLVDGKGVIQATNVGNQLSFLLQDQRK